MRRVALALILLATPLAAETICERHPKDTRMKWQAGSRSGDLEIDVRAVEVEERTPGRWAVSIRIQPVCGRKPISECDAPLQVSDSIRTRLVWRGAGKEIKARTKMPDSEWRYADPSCSWLSSRSWLKQYRSGFRFVETFVTTDRCREPDAIEISLSGQRNPYLYVPVEECHDAYGWISRPGWSRFVPGRKSTASTVLVLRNEVK